MAKRTTQVEVTKTFVNGDIHITLNKNKLNATMCQKIIERLAVDWKSSAGNSDIIDISFKCVG
jgi:hypothetical protein